MTEKPITQVCDLFFEVAQLPLVVCSRDGKPIYWLPTAEAPDEPAETNRQLVEKLDSLTTEQVVPFVEIIEPIFFWAAIRLEGDHYLIIGPAAPIRHAEGSIQKLSIMRNVAEEKRKAYVERVKQIPVVSLRHFLTTVSLLNYTLNQVLVPSDSFLLVRPSNTPDTEVALVNSLFEARENQVMHTPASYEHYILQAVTDGNIIKLKQALLSPLSGAVGRMSGDPIRQEKYTFISFVTLVTRASIAGGLNQELAYSLSDIYCQAVDRTQNLLEISKLAMEMSLDFTEKVAAAQGKARLSPTIASCCEQISGHLHDEIDLQQLANFVRLGPKALSKRFKNETGLSVADYIHREKIKEAQSLLKYSEYSISEIGYFLRYGSQSYFSSVFKKFSHVTPQQFREQVRKP